MLKQCLDDAMEASYTHARYSERKDPIFFAHLSFTLIEMLVRTHPEFRQDVYFNRVIVDKLDEHSRVLKTKNYVYESYYMTYRFSDLYNQARQVLTDTYSS